MPYHHYQDDTLFGVGSWTAGRYYTTTQATTTLNSTGTNGNPITTLRCHPIVVPRSATIDKLAIECTSAGDVNAVARLGIYNDDGTNFPGTLLQDYGITAALTPAAVYETSTTSVVLSQGVYWLACAMQNVAQNATAYSSAVQMRVINGASTYVGVTVTGGTIVGSSNPSNIAFGYGAAVASGALPGTFTVVTSLAAVNVIPVRVMAHCSV